MPDDPPLLFRWRRLVHRVRRADGPERIAGEWWRDSNASRATITASRTRTGGRFWLYRAGLYRPARAAALVPARGLRLSDRLRRAAGHQQFFLPARRLASRGAGGASAGAGPSRHRHHRPQYAGRRGARACRGERDAAAPRRRLPARSRRRHEPPLLSHRPRRLWRSVPPPHARQAPGDEGRMPPGATTISPNSARARFIVALPPDAAADDGLRALSSNRLPADFAGAAYLAAQHLYRGDDRKRIAPPGRSRRARGRAAGRDQRRALSRGRSGARCRTW